MSSHGTAPKRKLPIVPLAVLTVGAIAATILLLRGVDLRAVVDSGMAFIRDLGPVVFFAAMAVLPAVGVPLLFFTVTAGEAFAAKIGMGGVIAISLVAIAINLALGYWIARYAFRPLLARLMQRYGYEIPRVTSENALTVTLLVRLTPGPPYSVQAVILGLAQVPFRMYMIVSWLGILPWAIGGIVLGKGLFSGKFGVAAKGVAVLIVALILVQVVRKKYIAKRQAETAIRQ